MKNVSKKTLLSTTILSIALFTSGIANAQTTKLTTAETKEVLNELVEDMASEGIKVTFKKTPKMSYDATLTADIKELEKAGNDFNASTINASTLNATSMAQESLEAPAPLTPQAQSNVLKSVLQDLADHGVTVNFGNQPPKIEHLTVNDIQAEEAQYKAELKNIATDMLNSGNARNAVTVYEQANNGNDAKYAMEAIQDELASQGYKVTFSGTPTVSIDQSVVQIDMDKPLTANDKQDLVADMQERLADTGIIADLSKSKPSIERLPLPQVSNLDEKEFAQLDAQYDAELHKMAQQVMNSGSLDKAVDIIEAFENAGDDAELAM